MATVHSFLPPTDDERIESFNEFWKWYPLKKGKPKARALFLAITQPGGYRTRTLNKDSGAYIDLHLEATADEIVAAARRFWDGLPRVSPDSYSKDTTYCPHPTTWLNQGRWEDE